MESEFPRCALVAVGASAGGVPALRAFAAALPATLGAPVVIVLHIPPRAPSALAAILDRSGPLPASTAAHRTVLREGHLYVAPADRHVLVDERYLLLATTPAEGGHRPAVDPLLRSAAQFHGSRAIGIVLSGTGKDGAAGLATIVECGGTALVQDPLEAHYPGMPLNALHAVPGAVALRMADLVDEVRRRTGRSGAS
jgi:two-component system, chemotaxis family, protein-glutamate methylesterase/glutaminase